MSGPGAFPAEERSNDILSGWPKARFSRYSRHHQDLERHTARRNPRKQVATRTERHRSTRLARLAGPINVGPASLIRFLFFTCEIFMEVRVRLSSPLKLGISPVAVGGFL